ncbi:hypothetical protein HD554DRAFT_2072712 [Boletus coccyginus]|nr:hypothetical protein HD554DRAFT_2072712 [Boletus coccyginus]
MVCSSFAILSFELSSTFSTSVAASQRGELFGLALFLLFLKNRFLGTACTVMVASPAPVHVLPQGRKFKLKDSEVHNGT